ncbi:MAG: hypothetical protein NWF01_10130 [Candidatus Bathyarchaeota archaeon]|nr:hypothetical protein [Candidatus Bathyarchaeota archaeon]
MKDTAKPTPPQYGGTAKQESYSFTLNSVDSQISVSVVLLNGYITYLQVRPVSGDIFFSGQPQDSGVAQAQQILVAYQTWAQNNGLDVSKVSDALTLLDKAQDAPASSQSNQNFYGVSGFTPINATSGNMRMVASGVEIGFGYTFDDVDVRSRGLGLSFGSSFLFADTWGLYSVAAQNSISQEQAEALALQAAQDYAITLTSQNGTSIPVNPDWSSSRVEISLNMIPGQTFNNSVNDALNFVNSSVTREPLGLYPYWNAFVYFTAQVGYIDGVQVDIWGDTSEVAQVNTFSQLSHPVTSIPTLPPEPNNTLTLALIIGAVVVVLVVVVVALLKRK